MAVAFSPYFTQRPGTWSAFIAYAINAGAHLQYEEIDGRYSLWFYTDHEVHTCTIWKGTVPDSVITYYSQSQNDADKAAFEGTYKATANTVQKVSQKTQDGRLIFLPSTMRDASEVCFTGCGDDIENGIRMGGQDFKISASSQGDTTVTFQFMEPTDIAGGLLRYSNAVFGDYINYEIAAPATVGTSNPGAGVYDKYPLGGGANMYVPNATQEGDWDLDLTELYNENVAFTKVVPIPALAGDGFFDWSRETEAVTLNLEQKGGYNLFDFEMILARFINKCWMLDSDNDNFIVAASYGAKQILPHYQHKVKVHREGTSGTLYVVWYIFKGSDSTQPG